MVRCVPPERLPSSFDRDRFKITATGSAGDCKIVDLDDTRKVGLESISVSVRHRSVAQDPEDDRTIPRQCCASRTYASARVAARRVIDPRTGRIEQPWRQARVADFARRSAGDDALYLQAFQYLLGRHAGGLEGDDAGADRVFGRLDRDGAWMATHHVVIGSVFRVIWDG